MEKLKKKGIDVDSMSAVDIREKASEYAQQQIQLQKKHFMKWGVMGDWDKPYKTMQKIYEARQIGLFHTLYKKGLIYRGNKPVYWSPSSKTALAEAELEYNEEHVSPSIYVKFPVATLSEGSNHISKYENLSAVIWTTTPWTLPANKAICVHDNLEYVIVEVNSEHYIVEKNLSNDFQKKLSLETLKIVDSVSGEALKGTVTRHPFLNQDSPIFHGNHVTSESGTGLVHTAPGHGHDDYIICKQNSIKPYCPIDDNGVFTPEAGERLSGLYILDGGNKEVIKILEEESKLLAHNEFIHKYPYDWRTKKPVIIRTTTQWFTDLTGIKDQALSEVQGVNFFPQHGKNRLESFIGTRDEWCISRQRFWGVPIPSFYDENTGEEVLDEDIIKNIEDIFSKEGSDAWFKREVDYLLPKNYDKKGRSLVKGTDTMDVWFDSGSSWNSVLKENGFDKADIYLEGSDQHRGWFQSSVLLSVATRGIAPMKDIVTHGFVLDRQGKKMSKSLGNVVSPNDIIKGGKVLGTKLPGYGVDVLRYWISSVDFFNDIVVSPNILEDSSRAVRKIRNTARYILGNLYDYKEEKRINLDSLVPVDRYILSRAGSVAKMINEHYDAYNFAKAMRVLFNFVSVDLSGFYFEMLKDRLYTSDPSSEYRKSAQYVMFEVLNIITKSISPILCHTAEDIYQHTPLKKENTESQFQLGWFTNDIDKWIDDNLEKDWDEFRLIKHNLNTKVDEMVKDKKYSINKSSECVATLLIKRDYKLREFIQNLGESYLSEALCVANTHLRIVEDSNSDFEIILEPSAENECPRCWKRVNSCDDNLFCDKNVCPLN
eukprot:TRINITY_DN1103_c0_g1_i3.p1 TRINITY_DN1103_c0_g1~~TRINITY_DN1103_c0_g1_i3.p1  ORF type:complete len:954 (-),score=186.34 TRINITY_DN1103_c0_g1_i3:1041-3518(-)